MVIGRIERCAVANVEREGINYRIEMKVPGTRVIHVLRMPTAKDAGPRAGFDQCGRGATVH